MKSNVVYIADISGDIDDLIAIEYLYSKNRLSCVVFDGKSGAPEREGKIKSWGIKIEDEIPKGAKIVFCGGAFTKIEEFLKNKNESLDLLVVNGFFAGCNIVPQEYILEKFKGMEYCRSYNPNLDFAATWKVISNYNQIKEYLVVSKNVCHHSENIFGGWHKEEFLNFYGLKENKKLHDLFMCKEGLRRLDEEDLECHYEQVVLQSFLKGSAAKWGCLPASGSDLNFRISVYKK